MFGTFRKKSQSRNVGENNVVELTEVVKTFKIDGMHCASCSMNIDDLLEEIDGIVDSSTSYAKATTKVRFDQQKISVEKIILAIARLGYQVVPETSPTSTTK